MENQNRDVPSGKVRFIAGNTEFVIDDRYKFTEYIGRGAPSEISIRAKDELTYTRVTITKLENIFSDLSTTREIIKRIKLLRFLDHYHIESLISILLPSTSNFEEIYLVTDWMDTDLNRIINSKQLLTIDHIKYFMYMILHGLQYLHSANIVHYDLKPANIVLNANSDFKLTGLHSAKGIHHDLRNFPEYIVATWYRAPEVLYSPGFLMCENDLWSAGCIMAELMIRRPLFSCGDPMSTYRMYIEVLGTPTEEDMEYLNPEVKQFIRSLPYRERIDWKILMPKATEEAIDLLDKIFKFNPKDRIKAEECLKHPFFEMYEESEVTNCIGVFDWSFENVEASREVYERMIYEEALHYNNNTQ